MKISARIDSSLNTHKTSVQTNNITQELTISPKSTGYGSSVNGGELLLLSLATCFCNDIFREAKKKHISVTSVHVEFEAEFGADGETGRNFTYKANVVSDAPKEMIDDLIKHTDNIAEIHNTVRTGTAITLTN